MGKYVQPSLVFLVLLASGFQARAGVFPPGQFTTCMAAPQVVARETAAARTATPAGENPVVVLETSKGAIKIEVFPREAPKTVE
jgi:hypothetical protein